LTEVGFWERGREKKFIKSESEISEVAEKHSAMQCRAVMKPGKRFSHMHPGKRLSGNPCHRYS
jgi:hypothetical protein